MAQPFVSVTFDDGWKSAVTAAAPLLKRYQIPATFYIITNRLGDDYSEYVTAKDLRDLAEVGHEIGSHTRSHKHLPELSEQEIWYEITQGQKDLQELGFEPKTFAYPYGEWNPYVVKQVREAGFLAARSILQGANDQKTNPLLLRAYAVREEHSAKEVIGWIEAAAYRGLWLILYFHQIEPASILREKKWIYGTTPTVLEEILFFLREKEMLVLTVEQGMERLLKEILHQ